MPESGSFELRYVGSRFEGKRLPVDVLADLPAFRELLVAFARVEWRRLNTHRERLPKGFDASLALDLVAIDEGSAVPVLKWNRETLQEQLPGFSDQIEEVVHTSFGQVVKLFDDAENSQFPTTLAPDQIRALNKFGSNLRDGEKIEFKGQTNARGKVVYLSSELRKRLIGSLRDRYVAQLEVFGTLLGCVAKPDEGRGPGYIVVQTAAHGVFNVPTDNETLKSDFDGNINQPIELNLQVELDHQDHVTAVIDVRSVSLVDEQIAAQLTRCSERLKHVGAMKDGWHDGEGEAPSGLAIDLATKFLNRRFALCDVYRIYPTDEAGVLFEFENKGWDISVEFLFDGKVQIHSVEIDGHRSLEPLDFNGISDEFLAEFDKQAR
jgi:hypothetical protein